MGFSDEDLLGSVSPTKITFSDEDLMPAAELQVATMEAPGLPAADATEPVTTMEAPGVPAPSQAQPSQSGFGLLRAAKFGSPSTFPVAILDELERRGGTTRKDSTIKLGQGVIGYGQATLGAGSLLGRVNLMQRGAEALIPALRENRQESEAWMAQRFKDTNDILTGELSPAMQAKEDKLKAADGFVDSFTTIMTDPSLAAGKFLESVPTMMGLMGGTRAVALKAGEAAFARTMAQGAAQGLAPAAARESALAAAQAAQISAGTLANIGLNAAASGGSANMDIMQFVMEVPEEQLRQSPQYLELLEELGDPRRARLELAEQASNRAAAVSAAISGAATAVTRAGGFEARVATQQLGKGGALELGKNVGKETLEEIIQSGGEAFGGNVGRQMVNPNQDLMQGVGNAAGTGGALGAITGGGMHVAGRMLTPQQTQEPAPDAEITADPPQDAVKALPAPRMIVDQDGVAAPEAVREQAARDAEAAQAQEQARREEMGLTPDVAAAQGQHPGAASAPTVESTTQLEQNVQLGQNSQSEQSAQRLPSEAESEASVVSTPTPSRFPAPRELRAEEFTAKARSLGLTDEQIEGLRPQEQPDVVTGFYKAEDRVPTLERAQQWAAENGQPAVYIEADLANLGGLNAKLGHSGANKVYSAFAQFFREELERTGGTVVPFRHGGDEISAVVLGVDQKAVRAAGAQAQQRVTDYAREQGLAEIPHTKTGGAPGTGLYFGTAIISPSNSPQAIFGRADKRVEANKKEARNVDRGQAGTTGAVAPEGQARRAPRGAGAADRRGRAEGAGRAGGDAPAVRSASAQVDTTPAGATPDLPGGRTPAEQARKKKERNAPDMAEGAGDLFSGKSKQTEIEDVARPERGGKRQEPIPGEAPGRIEDFGEKLEGARKFLPPALKDELGDDDITRLPLSKIWPADAHEAIEDVGAAALAFAARKEIPAKPRTPHKLKRWVEKVKLFRGLLHDLGGDIVRLEQLAVEKGFSSLRPFFSKVRLLTELPRDTWGRIGGIEEYPDAYRYAPESGKKVATPFSVVTIDGKTQRFGVGRIGPDEIEKVRAMLGATVPKQGGLTAKDFEIRRRRSGGAVFVNRKGDSEYRPLKEFSGDDAVAQARAWLENNTEEAVAAWEAVKARDNVSKADTRRERNREREGENRRGGKDVTEQMFTDAFGFRGVQFGNWVKQGKGAKDRQGLLNEAYDALLDLADLLGIPSRAISLNGTLGLSLGARGHGQASAHFESSNLVINLTKTRGAGTLAHEWFHALDNYFSRQRGGEVAFTGDQEAYRRSNYITYKPEPLLSFKPGPNDRRSLPDMTRAELMRRHREHPTAGIYNPERWEPSKNHPQGVRPEVEKAFAELVEALNDSPMAKRASKLDKKADGYWSRIIERGARSFENYVISKMAQRGWTNDFLANVRAWDEWARIGKNADRYPYLTPEEEAPVVAAFDNLFSTVEVRETDQGLALYSLADVTHSQQSVLDSLPREGMSVAAVERVAREYLNGFKAGLPEHEYVVARDAEAAFGADALAAKPDLAKARGAYYPASRRLLLVSSALRDADAVRATIRHELLAHYGLNLFEPDVKAAILDRVSASRSVPGLSDVWADIDRIYHDMAESVRAEEVLARLAEDLEPAPRWRRWLDDFSSWLAQRLRSIGFLRGKVTAPELRNLLRAIAEGIRNGARQRTQPMDDAAQFASERGAAPVFYSQLRQVLAAKLPGAAPAPQMLEAVRAFARKGEFKGEELEWSGLQEWLAEQEGRVSKAQVLDFVDANRIEVQEVLKGATDDTKFKAYTLPGGENYRELLLTLPEPIDAPEEPSYRSHHFDEPNVLAHVRFNERTDAEGKRTLFIEEVQSDWHQQGRRRGYDGAGPITPEAAIEHIAREMDVTVDDVRDHYGYRHDEAYIPVARDVFGMKEGGVPDAPFKTTWPMLAFKRMLRWAAEEGFDRIAWTNGEQQAARYDLSRQVEAIVATRNGDEATITAVLHSNSSQDLGVHPISNLAEVVGKDLADKIAEQEDGVLGRKRYEGVDLKVGGEGMRGFYDQILPKEVGKYIKKWGGKVGQATISYLDARVIQDREVDGRTVREPLERQDPVHAVDITPAMREAALGGQPMFSRSGNLRELTEQEMVAAREFLEGEPVARMNGDEVPRFGRMRELIDWVADHWSRTTDGIVKRPDLGDVRLSKQSVRDTIAHGMGPAKQQAFYLVPEILTKGRLLGQLEKSNPKKPDAFLIGAPVSIGGKDYYGLVSVRRDANGSQMYVHEAVLREKGTPAGVQSAAAAGGSQLGSARAGAIATLLRKVLSVNPPAQDSPVADGALDPDEPRFSRVRADSNQSEARKSERNDPFAAENRRLREQDKTLWHKARQQLVRQFAPGGLLPKPVFDTKVRRDSEFQAVEFDVRHMAGALEKAVKADFGRSMEALPASEMRRLGEALAGKVDPALPEATRVALIAMRRYIDALSGKYIGILQQQVANNLKDADPELIQTITGNLGSYVHRSYRAFDDPKWFKKVSTSTVNAARRHLALSYHEQGASVDEAKRLADVTVNELLKTGTAYDSMESFIAEGNLGAKDLSVLMRRKEIAQPIRALLGEYADPRINFAKSATKMGRLVWNQRFLDRVRHIGMGAFLFEGKDRPAAATAQIAGEQSDVYAPLNGLWTFPEVAQAFKDALGKEQMGQLYRTVVRLNGLVKYGKTVLSPTTAMRNWQSALFFSLANGHFDLTQMGKSWAAFREQVTQNATGGDLAYMRRLKRLGVVYDTPYAGEMMRLLEDARMEELLSGRGGEGITLLRRFNQTAQGFYSFGDDFWKIIGFENEKAGLIKAGIAPVQAELMAAERIRNTYPTYSMVGRGINWLRRFPLAGTFVSFPAEIVRTSVNMLRLTASDLKSDNPGLRALGRKRAAGMAMVSAGFYALSALTAAMFGVSDDEEEAIRDLAAPWQRNSTLLYTGRDAEGRLRYFDMSFLDPYGYWKRPITAMLRDQPWEKSAASALGDMLEPFLGEDIVAGALFQVLANKKGSGGKVFLENAPASDQALDIADHLRKAVQPGFVSNAERLILAAKGERREGSGQPYDMRDELVTLVGWRATTLDVPTALYYRSFDFSDGLGDANKILMRKLRSSNPVSDSEILSARETAQRRREKAFTEMSRLVVAARATGMSEAQIRQTLKNSGISEVNSHALRQGRVPPMEISLQAQRNAIKQARERHGAEHAAEVARRFRVVREKN